MKAWRSRPCPRATIGSITIGTLIVTGSVLIAAFGPPAPTQSPQRSQRTEINLLGETASESGESRRNENVQFNLVDNNGQGTRPVNLDKMNFASFGKVVEGADVPAKVKQGDKMMKVVAEVKE